MEVNTGPIIVTESLIESASLGQLADMVRGMCASYRRLLENITAERKLYERHIASIEQKLTELQPRADHQKAADQLRIETLQKSLAITESLLRKKNREVRSIAMRYEKLLPKLGLTRQQNDIAVTCEHHLL
jgi:hypothetical protein